jgi:hypothetical protein
MNGRAQPTPTVLDHVAELFLHEASMARGELVGATWLEIEKSRTSGGTDPEASFATKQRLFRSILDAWQESLVALTEKYAQVLKDIVEHHPEVVGADTEPPQWARSQLGQLLGEDLGYEVSGVMRHGWKPKTPLAVGDRVTLPDGRAGTIKYRHPKMRIARVQTDATASAPAAEVSIGLSQLEAKQPSPTRSTVLWFYQSVCDPDVVLDDDRREHWCAPAWCKLSFEVWVRAGKPEHLDVEQTEKLVRFAETKFAMRLSHVLDQIEHKVAVAIASGRDLSWAASAVTSPGNAEPSSDQVSHSAAGPSRRRVTVAVNKRLAVIFGAIQAKLKGMDYCKKLDAERISIPGRWTDNGCPSTYVGAYQLAAPWRKKIQDEKHRFKRKYDSVPAPQREKLIQEGTRHLPNSPKASKSLP